MIWWTGDAICLLWFRLIISFATFNANIDGCVEICARCADRQWALFDWSWSDLWCCSTQWTRRTSWLNSLRSVCSTWTWLTLAIDTQLHARCALIATFGAWFGLSWSCCLSKSANFTWEWAFVWLEESMSARSAESSVGIEVFSCRATFLTVRSWACSIADGHTRPSWDVWTFCALSLTSFRLIVSTWTTRASLIWCFVECSNRAGNAIWNHSDLADRTCVVWAELEWWGIWNGVGKDVFNSKLIIFKNEFLQEFLNRWTFTRRWVNDGITEGKILQKFIIWSR